ncbi:MAG: hypothetical protein HN390_03785 [Anaerolineae bacterium]|jgi:predicted SnoaL-like aldol condensation-catalyzing enzyme|nr:hypothetical protein [Anaerolineae bacterium]MBT7189288.1 hypothetical protein [Anaerolineae bacterium]MBT7990376.1 hypothetical protein [Anaerolineae bacterium]
MNDKKEIAREYYKALYSAKYKEAIATHLSDTYIEHQIGVGFSKQGLANYMRQHLAENPAHELIIHREIAQDDLVFFHADEKLAGGEMIARGELFRFQGDKIVEHWSAGQEHPKKTVSGRSLTDGAGVDYSSNTGRQHAQLTADSYYKTFVELRTDLILFTTTERYYQHNPRTADGSQAFFKGVSLFKKLRFLGIKLHLDIKKTIAEGDFVVTMSNIGSKPILPNSIVFDLFRVQVDGKKDEHWDVTETIKPKEAITKVF